MARIHKTKGIELVIEACSILLSRGYRFKWYFMGSGDKYEYYKDIKQRRLENTLYLVDALNNPIPYLAQADIYIQPSLYEGKSNAVNEAKALYKPIVITNFTSSKDHINHGTNGLISEMNSQSLAESIILLIDNERMRNSFTLNLKTNFKGNIKEVNKLYELLN